jgi:DNA invertase Pin-like site-specific DNA recombinase
MQLDALEKAGVTTVFQEKASAGAKRPVLAQALDSIYSGDILVVWKLDRLARSLRDLLNILQRLHLAGAGIRSLTESIDTATPSGMLMVQVLGAVAQFERSIIRERSIAGQRAAIDRGIIVGRPRSMTRECERDAVRMWRTGFYSLENIALIFDAHPSTIKRAVYREEKPDHSSLR